MATVAVTSAVSLTSPTPVPAARSTAAATTGAAWTGGA